MRKQAPGLVFMRTTLTLDDELMAKAARYTGLNEKSAIVQRALKTLVELEAGRRLALIGGTDPFATAGPRRRSDEDQ